MRYRSRGWYQCRGDFVFVGATVKATRFSSPSALLRLRSLARTILINRGGAGSPCSSRSHGAAEQPLSRGEMYRVETVTKACANLRVLNHYCYQTLSERAAVNSNTSGG